MVLESQRAADQFSRQARFYATSAAHSDAESLRLIGQLASDDRYPTAVDVATGPGFTAFAVAPYAGQVLATDVAPGMLQQVVRIAVERGISNVQPALAAAESLPFQDASVDLVTSRTAPHHFLDLEQFIAEAARILRPRGTFIIGDTSAPEDQAIADWMNDVELRRDHTHVCNRKPSEWRSMLKHAGFEIDHESITRVHLEFEDWVKRSATPADEIERLRKNWREAPAAVVEAFQIVQVPGDIENHRFAWPVWVERARKTG